MDTVRHVTPRVIGVVGLVSQGGRDVGGRVKGDMGGRVGL